MKHSLYFLLLGLMVGLGSDTFCLSRLLSRTSQAPRAVRRPAHPAAQKRTLMTPAQIKGMYDPLTEIAKPVSPVVGAVKYETGALQRIYEVPSETSAIKLVQELFYQQESQFKPTANKSKAAYALSPSILGLVIGALEAGKLKDQTVRKDIIRRWQDEYKKITEEKKAFSETKINNLLNLIEAEYEHDKNSCRSILLGFLYAKADPDDNHDMIHYLVSLNEYIPVFADAAINKEITPKKPESKIETNWLSSTMQALKKYFAGNTFTPQKYQATRTMLTDIGSRHTGIDKALTDQFEVILATILDEKGNKDYPSKVIQSQYGYDGQPSVPNCVEAAMQDLFNIIVYDPESRSFDLARLSNLPGVILHENFKKFYQDYKNEAQINSPITGQAWMNLVSAIPGIAYEQGNYELPNAYSKNLLALASHFLGTSIASLDELGRVLSDEQTIITFTEEQLQRNSKINMKMITQDKTLEADLCSASDHGELKVKDRDVDIKKTLLNQSILAEKYHLNDKARLLFESQGNISSILLYMTPYSMSPIREVPLSQIPASAYYTHNLESLQAKADLISSIIWDKNSDDESLDYAYHLFSQLPAETQESFIDPVMESGIQSGKVLSNPILKKLALDNMDLLSWKLFYESKMSIEKIISYIKELYTQIPGETTKSNFIDESWGYVIKRHDITTEAILDLYKLFADTPYQKIFLSDFLVNLALLHVHEYHAFLKKVDVLAVVQQCVKDGIDFSVTGSTEWLGNGWPNIPLLSAIFLNNSNIVDVLLSAGAPVNIHVQNSMLSTNSTILGVAIGGGMSEKIVKLLLEHGADLNMNYGNDKNGEPQKINYPIFTAIERLPSKSIMELLIQYGADVNVINGEGKTPLDFYWQRRKTAAWAQQEEVEKILVNAGAKTAAQLEKQKEKEQVARE